MLLQIFNGNLCLKGTCEGLAAGRLWVRCTDVVMEVDMWAGLRYINAVGVIFTVYSAFMETIGFSQYSTAICVSGPDIFLAGTATLPAPITSPRGCLACDWVSVWMGQIEQAWFSSSPQLQNVYARSAHCWTGAAQPRRNSTDSLFLHFPEHHRSTNLPINSPARVSTSPNQTCTLLLCIPSQRELFGEGGGLILHYLCQIL